MSDTYRMQVLANARCLYGPEIEVVTLSHKIKHKYHYQAAVMKRQNDASPWVNMLYGRMQEGRANAMEGLLFVTEDELAKRLLEKGITLPLLEDDSVGFEVTHLARSESVVSLEESSDGSEFEFIATPASSSAGDFSEDESESGEKGKELIAEEDKHVNPTPASADARLVQPFEESPVQQSTIPFEVNSEPQESAKIADATDVGGPQVCGIQDTTIITDKDQIADAANEIREYRKQWKQKDERWAAMVGELRDITQMKGGISKEFEATEHKSSLGMGCSPTYKPRNLSTNTWEHKWESEGSSSGNEKEMLEESLAAIRRISEELPAHWKAQPNTSNGKETSSNEFRQKSSQLRKVTPMHAHITQVYEASIRRRPDFPQLESFPVLHAPKNIQPAKQNTSGHSKSNSSSNETQTLFERMNAGISPEKMSKAQELVDDSSMPKVEEQFASARETREKAISNEEGNQTDSETRYTSTSGDRPTHLSHGLQARFQTTSRASPNHSAERINLPKISSPLNPHSMKTWPLPAKKAKVKSSVSDGIDILSPQRLDATSSNPWSSAKNANVSWREPEAILDQYNSSLWGIPKGNKQKKSASHDPLPTYATKPLENESQYSPEVADAIRSVDVSISSSTKLQQTLQQQRSRQQSTGELRSFTTSQLPGFHMASSPYGLRSLDHQTTDKASLSSDGLPKLGSIAKNPFERTSQSSKDLNPRLDTAEKDPWAFGNFTSWQDSSVAAQVQNATAEKEPWSWKDITPNPSQQEKKAEQMTDATKVKVSPWPYLEPESQATPTASVSHQSLLDELAEWGSFSNKKKEIPTAKKPVAFDFLVETPLELAPKADSGYKKATAKPVNDEFERGLIGSQNRGRNRKGKLASKEARHLDLVEDKEFGMGFRTLSMADTSKQAGPSTKAFVWNEYGTKKGNVVNKDDSTVSEMSGEDKSATAPVHADAQSKYHNNVLRLNHKFIKGESSNTNPSYTKIETAQTPQTCLYVLNITYKHLLATEHFRHVIDASFSKKAAIIEEVNKFVSAREPFGQIYKRKILIRNAKGDDGIVDLERLEEGSWDDILGFLEDTTRVIEITVMVNDI